MARHCFDSSMLLGFDISISDRFMMVSSSGEQVHSNRNYRCLLPETFDGQETADDELSDNLDGNDNIIQESIQDFPLILEPFEPFIGMEFESAEDAREFMSCTAGEWALSYAATVHVCHLKIIQ
ncbi:hypothetical protein H0E87_028635 [Populus deltoides]|uniref:Uncharacterized protein n=1 Tax=Populus deltoides TaxID=3696 RepID=A0A8T2WV01_POPDE|nr:hypothetical protein H0E87_028632 [Populus deltoides]KAH8484265.1 hypothetical protein H0E87_028635 [Populus deltoides]